MSTRLALAFRPYIPSSQITAAIAVASVLVLTASVGNSASTSSGGVALSLPAARTHAPVWRYVGGGPVSPGGVLCTQVRIAWDGTPHVAYQDLTSSAHRLGVRRFANGAWSALTTIGSGSTGDAWYNRIAFQRDGSFLIASRDYGLAGALGVRRCAYPGAPWQALSGAAASPGEAHYTDVLALPNGRIFAAFQDRTTLPIDRTTVIEFDGSTWQNLTGAGLSGGYSAYQSLAPGPHGTVLVAFTDGALAGRASVFAYGGAQVGWQPVGPQAFTPDIPNNLVLRVGADGTPYVAYYVWNSRIVVRRFDGSGWPNLGLEVDGADIPAVETEGWRQWLGMDIDSVGRPVVAYEAANLGRRAVVKRWDPSSGTWETLGEPGFTPSSADYLSLALAPDDTPYVAFRDGTNGRAAVMAWR